MKVYVVMIYVSGDGWQPDSIVHISEDKAFEDVKKFCDESISHSKYDHERAAFESSWMADRENAAFFKMVELTDGEYMAEVFERELAEPTTEEKLDEGTV